MSTDLTHADITLSQRVADEIRAWMGRRRISGAALGRALGKSTAWVSYRLTGAQPIDLNDLEKIAAVLDVEVADLLPPARAREGRLITTANPRAETVRTLNDRSSRPAERPTLSGRPSPTSPAESTRRPVRRRPVTAS